MYEDVAISIGLLYPILCYIYINPYLRTMRGQANWNKMIQLGHEMYINYNKIDYACIDFVTVVSENGLSPVVKRKRTGRIKGNRLKD